VERLATRPPIAGIGLHLVAIKQPNHNRQHGLLPTPIAGNAHVPIWAVRLDRIVAVSVVDCDQVWIVESGSSMFPARRVVAVDGVQSGFAERDRELPLKI